MSTTSLCGYKYQPRAPALNTSTLAIVPVPLHFSAFSNSVAVFPPFFIDPIDLMASEGNRGKSVAEEVPRENLSMSQRLYRMR